MKFGIIGAGATGLAAAYDLSRKGHQVKIYESSDFIGGHAGTFEISGTELEKGYHHWFTNDTDILSLINEIGLQEIIEWFPSSVGTYQDGQIYDFLSAFDLMKFRPLSLLNRVKMGLSSLKIRYIKDWQQLECISAKEWLSQNSNQEIYDSFWAPMLRGSFSHLFRKLAETCEMHSTEIFLSTRVNRIEGLDSGQISMSIGQNESEEIFDAVIASTPSHIFNHITEGLSEEYKTKLLNIKYMAAVLIILVMDRPLTNVYWLNIADRSIPFIGVIEHTNLVEPEIYGNKRIVYLSNYLAEDDPLYNMSSKELFNTYLPHLEKINRDFSNEWVKEYHHFKIPNAQPVVDTNYSKNIPEHETGIQNLYLANTSQVYPQDRGTNYSVAMGRKMAALALQKLKIK